MDVRVTYKRILGTNLYNLSEDIYENAEFTVNKLGLCRIIRNGKTVTALRGWEKVEYGGEDKPKKVVTKEAEYAGHIRFDTMTTEYNPRDFGMTKQSFKIPINAKNIRCLYDVEEDQHIELDTRRGKL